uniref:Uncharacterized protein n=1 Tax=Kalanchoe fedtschenkoi TaxID=63787 RepID=A0A7N0V9G6_KALFE
MRESGSNESSFTKGTVVIELPNADRIKKFPSVNKKLSQISSQAERDFSFKYYKFARESQETNFFIERTKQVILDEGTKINNIIELSYCPLSASVTVFNSPLVSSKIGTSAPLTVQKHNDGSTGTVVPQI